MTSRMQRFSAVAFLRASHHDRLSRAWAAAVGLALLAFGSSAWASGYSFTDLSGSDVLFSEAYAINNLGQVAGKSQKVGQGSEFATLWSNGVAVDLGAAGGTSSAAFGINDRGQVAGTTTVGNTSSFATLWDAGGSHDLGTLGGLRSGAFAINNSGQVVGLSQTPGHTQSHATLWNNGVPIDLGTLGGASSQANAINDVGTVIGDAETAGRLYAPTVWGSGSRTGLPFGAYNAFANGINDAGVVAGVGQFTTHAVTWNGSVATDLGTLGGAFSEARDVNNAGQVVGYSLVAKPGDLRAALWENGSAIDLNTFLSGSASKAGWELNTAYAINDKGWIVGGAFNQLTGQHHAYLLQPVPEPATYALWLIGLAGVAFTLRRQRAWAEGTAPRLPARPDGCAPRRRVRARCC